MKILMSLFTIFMTSCSLFISDVEKIIADPEVRHDAEELAKDMIKDVL